jgi:hypothetical protein
VVVTTVVVTTNAVVIVVVVVIFRFNEIGRVEEPTLFRTDVDESRLHARQYRLDLAEVDVAYGSVDLWLIDQQFN